MYSTVSVNKYSIQKFADVRIQTADLWFRKQLSHNHHCQMMLVMLVSLLPMRQDEEDENVELAEVGFSNLRDEKL